MKKRLRTAAFIVYTWMVPFVISGALSLNSQKICDIFCRYWFSPVLDFIFGFPVGGTTLIFLYLVLSDKIDQDSKVENIKNQLLMYIPLLTHIGFAILYPGIKSEILLEEIQLIPIGLLLLIGTVCGASLTTYMPKDDGHY